MAASLRLMPSCAMGSPPFEGLRQKDSGFKWLRGIRNQIGNPVRFEMSTQASWRRRIRINLTGFIPDLLVFGQENENPST